MGGASLLTLDLNHGFFTGKKREVQAVSLWIVFTRYFEVEVVTPGYMRVGWARVCADPSIELGGGSNSYGFDGYLVRKLRLSLFQPGCFYFRWCEWRVRRYALVCCLCKTCVLLLCGMRRRALVCVIYARLVFYCCVGWGDMFWSVLFMQDSCFIAVWDEETCSGLCCLCKTCVLLLCGMRRHVLVCTVYARLAFYCCVLR